MPRHAKECPKKGCKARFFKKSRYMVHLRRDHGEIQTW